MDDLLRSCSWHAEKLLRKRGHFNTVLFLAQHGDSSRERMFERYCNNAPDSASDAGVLAELAADVAADFAETGVTRFAVAYLARRVTVTTPVNPSAAMQPTTTKRQGVIIELHGDHEQVSVFRELIRLPRRAPMLAAPTDEPFIVSPYSGVLQVAAQAAAAKAALQVKAAVKAKVEIGTKVAAKAAVKVAAREASSWPPQFLLNSPRRPIQPA